MSHWGLDLSQFEIELDRQARRHHRTLLAHETFWRDHQVWLAERGYMLRPRYKPDWQPSWEGEGQAWRGHEDGIVSAVSYRNFDIGERVLCTTASFCYRRNSTVGWRDCYSQESLAYKRPF